LSYIKNLICRQGDFVLDIPFMEWPDKGVSALVGASGSGKSTLATCLCGFKKAEDGFKWIFKDRDINLLSPPDRKISIMLQSLELFPHISAEKNILFPALARRIKKEERVKRLLMIDKFLYLSSFLKKPVHLLSGGEKQRVALARALIINSQFLILDEPFSSLDGKLKKSAMHLIKQIEELDKTPILFISHNEEEIKFLANKKYYLQNGKLK